ncbi:hypothetical protein BFJ69_g15298 [Fusarium oxysporum]|uniref:Zn(2)-C6 fungal-type domain-containing protein n=1 Tax=Fusarium oxysporum TaxID=5507 RepID=A0A420MEN6_FUSOX|nr:hypothetical protein BFJ69_g15298 [Fusarium oxysporum]
MKTRNRTICQTCRSRKIGCDGQKPACSQCIHTGRECSYPLDFIFITETTTQGSKDTTKQSKPKTNSSNDTSLCPRSQSNVPLALELLPKTPRNPVQDMVLLIMQSFMPEAELLTFSQNTQTQPRICGGWVEVLPMISIGGQGQALPSAISCLAASISSLRQNTYSGCSVSLEKYGSAMRLLKREIDQPRKEILSRDEVAAAIMCLTLTEAILPSSGTSWWRHVDGVGEWMRLWGPESFSLGARHKLFTGFRPLLVLKDFMSRKASFLSTEDWKRLPFESQQATAMQLLLSEASAIPTILELIDTLEHSPPSVSSFIAAQAIASLTTSYDNLQGWGEPLDADPSTCLFCWRTPSNSSWAWGGYNIWFPSVSAANLVMHLSGFPMYLVTGQSQQDVN